MANRYNLNRIADENTRTAVRDAVERGERRRELAKAHLGWRMSVSRNSF